MKLPRGKTEKEVLDIIENIANRLIRKFQFGYYGLEDMKQEAYLEAFKKLDKYDNVRPLENFLFRVIHNALYNLKRNKFARPDLPCHTCPLQNLKLESGCEEYVDKMECDLYNNWFVRNQTKKNLASTVSIDYVLTDKEDYLKSYDVNLETMEMIELIEENLPTEFREDWLRLRQGLRLTKNKKDKLLNEIFSILEEKNISVEDWMNE